MERKQILGVLLLLMFAAAVIGADAIFGEKNAAPEGADGYEELLANTPVAELEGEPVSPDGRYEVRTAGRTDNYVSGVVPPESIQIIDAAAGTSCWEIPGCVWQSVRWSPDGSFLALACTVRTWSQIFVIDTDTWSSWEMVQPSGESIPEYTFLPDDWGIWLDENHLLLTLGRGGDAGEQRTYRCSVFRQESGVDCSLLEQTTEILSEAYDFDHDGEPEVTSR